MGESTQETPVTLVISEVVADDRMVKYEEWTTAINGAARSAKTNPTASNSGSRSRLTAFLSDLNKKVIIGMTAVYPLILLVNQGVGPFLTGLPPKLALLISVMFVSALMTYPVMPLLTR